MFVEQELVPKELSEPHDESNAPRMKCISDYEVGCTFSSPSLGFCSSSCVEKSVEHCLCADHCLSRKGAVSWFAMRKGAPDGLVPQYPVKGDLNDPLCQEWISVVQRNGAAHAGVASYAEFCPMFNSVNMTSSATYRRFL